MRSLLLGQLCRFVRLAPGQLGRVQPLGSSILCPPRPALRRVSPGALVIEIGDQPRPILAPGRAFVVLLFA